MVAVDVDSGTTATESLTVRFDEPGEYDLILTGDALAAVTDEGAEPDEGEEPAEAGLGSVTVTETGSDGSRPSVGDGTNGDGADGDESAAPAGEDGLRASEPSDLDLSDFAGLVTLVAIVLATLFLARRAPR